MIHIGRIAMRAVMVGVVTRRHKHTGATWGYDSQGIGMAICWSGCASKRGNGMANRLTRLRNN